MDTKFFHNKIPTKRDRNLTAAKCSSTLIKQMNNTSHCFYVILIHSFSIFFIWLQNLTVLRKCRTLVIHVGVIKVASKNSVMKPKIVANPGRYGLNFTCRIYPRCCFIVLQLFFSPNHDNTFPDVLFLFSETHYSTDLSMNYWPATNKWVCLRAYKNSEKCTKDDKKR